MLHKIFIALDTKLIGARKLAEICFWIIKISLRLWSLSMGNSCVGEKFDQTLCSHGTIQ